MICSILMSAIVQISKSCWAGISFVKRGPALDMCIPMTRAVVRRRTSKLDRIFAFFWRAHEELISPPARNEAHAGCKASSLSAPCEAQQRCAIALRARPEKLEGK